MSFFVSESIKEIIDSDSLIERNESDNSGLSAIFKKNDRIIKFDVKKITFDNTDPVNRCLNLFFKCYSSHIEMFLLKKEDQAFLKIGNKKIKIKYYDIDSIIEDSKDTYIISLLCQIE